MTMTKPPRKSRRKPANRPSLKSPEMLRRFLRLSLLLSIVCAASAVALAQSPPDRDYLVYVLSESADRIALVRFGPGGAQVDHDLHTGEMPSDLNGPHGIVISPDKKFYYVSLGHGRPFGTVWKYATEGDRPLGQTTLGLFPATM